MELTPQLINEEEFTLKVRGYDPDQVDVFLEKVAVGVEHLLEQLRDAKERTAAAERRAAEADKRAADAESRPPVTIGNAEAEEIEAIRRTLVLAQRTADAAIREAEETAARTVATAQQEASRLLQEGGDQGRKMVAEAEAEARRTTAETRQRMVEEILELERIRDAIRADISVLERHVDEQRLRLRSSVGELQRLLDDPSRMRPTPGPELSGLSVAEPVGEEAPPASEGPLPPIEPDMAGPEPEAAPVPALDEAAAVAPEPEPEAEAAVEPEAEPPAPADESTEDPWARSARDDPRPFLDEVNEEAWARFAPDDASIDPGPPTQPVPATGPSSGDDAYLAELRKAMLDEGDIGPEPVVFDQDHATDEPRAKSRFGWRR